MEPRQPEPCSICLSPPEEADRALHSPQLLLPFLDWKGSACGETAMSAEDPGVWPSQVQVQTLPQLSNKALPLSEPWFPHWTILLPAHRPALCLRLFLVSEQAQGRHTAVLSRGWLLGEARFPCSVPPAPSPDPRWQKQWGACTLFHTPGVHPHTTSHSLGQSLQGGPWHCTLRW